MNKYADLIHSIYNTNNSLNCSRAENRDAGRGDGGINGDDEKLLMWRDSWRQRFPPGLVITLLMKEIM